MTSFYETFTEILVLNKDKKRHFSAFFVVNQNILFRFFRQDLQIDVRNPFCVELFLYYFIIRRECTLHGNFSFQILCEVQIWSTVGLVQKSLLIISSPWICDMNILLHHISILVSWIEGKFRESLTFATRFTTCVWSLCWHLALQGCFIKLFLIMKKSPLDKVHKLKLIQLLQK